MTDTPPAIPSAPRKTDHLQGVTLENLLNQLVDQYGWATLSDLVRINCFRSNPSIRSSLTFLRRTPWARAQVEAVFIGFKDGLEVEAIRGRLKTMAAGDGLSKAAQKQKSATAKPRKPGAPDPWKKARGE